MGPNSFKCNNRDECTPSGNSQCTETPVDATCSDLDAVQLFNPGTGQQSWDYQYACLCPAGYEGNGYNAVPSCPDCTGCQNIDECNDPTACDLSVSTCVDNDGSYECSCKIGYEINGHNTCGDVNECVDDNGNLTGETDVCADGASDHLCDVCTNPGASAKCQNTVGSFECQCMPGYGGDQCQDLDECTDGGHTCSSVDEDGIFKIAAACGNFPAGSFTCGCDPSSGFILTTGSDGNSYCHDVNECDTLPKPCALAGDGDNEVNQVCINEPGQPGQLGYRCECPSGYEKNGSGDCIDIDECADSAQYGCPVNSTCRDTDGSYECDCATGFNMVHGATPAEGFCQNINECDSENDCHANAICTDNDGSYTCACARSNGENEVPAGVVTYQVFTGDGYKTGTGCEDIDECSLGTDHHNCDSPTICENNPNPTKNLVTGEWGGFNCICGPGTTQTVQLTVVNNAYVSLVDCVDDDECEDKLHSCNTLTGSECTDTDYGDGSTGPDGQQLGYRCSCPAGFRFESCDVNGENCDELGDCVVIDQCNESDYPSGTHYAHQCNELSECNEASGQIHYDCDCITGTEHTTDVVTMNNGDEISNVCEDINECASIDGQTSWPVSFEYEGHNYQGCPVGSFDCCPENSTCQNLIVTPNSSNRMQCNCNSGFTADTREIDGVTYDFCFDVLECADSNVCLQTGATGANFQLICQEQKGSFACACPAGTTGTVVSGDNDINTLQCENYNECTQSDPNPCGTTFGNQCTDLDDLTVIAQYNGQTDGQGFLFECSCKPGFQDGNVDCRDENDPLYPGSNECGYSCVNIDECLDDNHGCDEHANCQDRTPDALNDATHLCKCDLGWTGGDEPGQICTGGV